MSKSDSNNCVLLSITGCEDILPPEFGTFVYEMDEAIAKFECPGRQLVGQSVLGCDGQYWNGTEPFCVALTTTTTTTMRSQFHRPLFGRCSSKLDRFIVDAYFLHY